MPLVVPGVNSTSGDKTEEWTNKLVGKKLSDEQSDETVRLHVPCLCIFEQCADDMVVLLQARPPRGNPDHRARNDGYKGL